MKILTLTQNVIDIPTLSAGIAEAQKYALTIGLPLEFSFKETVKQFNSVSFSNKVNANGFMVNPSEIFQEAKATGLPFDVALLVYDWTKISPQPTNPDDMGQNMQIPIQWYVNYPDVFAEFFLHELCHYFFQATGKTDITHLLVDGDMQVQYPDLYTKYKNAHVAYYLYLLQGLYIAPQAIVIHKTLRIGSTGTDVIFLQQKLGLPSDGIFGPNTQKAVEIFQLKQLLIADGVVGPNTWNKLLNLQIPSPIITPTIKDIIQAVCLKNGIEPELGIAVASCEGGLVNPNVIRTNTDSHKSIDRGIFQFNSYWQPQITDTQAFDPAQATQAFCDEVKAGNLLTLWHLSQPCWSKKVSEAILVKYKVV